MEVWEIIDFIFEFFQNLQFLDLTGLNRREIAEIHAWLFDGNNHFILPWRNGTKSALSKYWKFLFCR